MCVCCSFYIVALIQQCVGVCFFILHCLFLLIFSLLLLLFITLLFVIPASLLLFSSIVIDLHVVCALSFIIFVVLPRFHPSIAVIVLWPKCCFYLCPIIITIVVHKDCCSNGTIYRYHSKPLFLFSYLHFVTAAHFYFVVALLCCTYVLNIVVFLKFLSQNNFVY